MAILNPTQLSAEAQVIQTETAQGANTASRIGQMYQDIIDSGVYTVKVSLSSAEILQLNSTPKELVAAPGAGLYIRVFGITSVLNYGTTTYSGSNMRVLIPAALVAQSTSYTGGANSITNWTLSTLSNIDPTDWVNQPLTVDVQGANPTTGDGTVDINITYAIFSI